MDKNKTMLDWNDVLEYILGVLSLMFVVSGIALLTEIFGVWLYMTIFTGAIIVITMIVLLVVRYKEHKK